MRYIAVGGAIAILAAGGIGAGPGAQAHPTTAREAATSRTPWASKCGSRDCWNIRITSIPRRIGEDGTFTVRLESRLTKPTQRQGSAIDVVFFNAPSLLGFIPSLDLVSVTIVRGKERTQGSGSCGVRDVMAPPDYVGIPSVVCSTRNSDDRLVKGNETRILKFAFTGGSPVSDAHRPVAYLVGLPASARLETESVAVRYLN